MRVGFPARMAAEKLATCSASTAMIFAFGRRLFTARATPGEQAAAADRHDDRIEIRHLLDDLESHRALAGDDGRIVVAVDVGEPAFSFAISCACALASPKSFPCMTTVAPSFWQLPILMSGANFGITTVAGMPRSLP